MSVRAPVIDTIFFMGRCLSKRDNIRLRASRIRSTFVHMRPKLFGLKQLNNTVFEGFPAVPATPRRPQSNPSSLSCTAFTGEGFASSLTLQYKLLPSFWSTWASLEVWIEGGESPGTLWPTKDQLLNYEC